jgi:hypothetical protein
MFHCFSWCMFSILKNVEQPHRSILKKWLHFERLLCISTSLFWQKWHYFEKLWCTCTCQFWEIMAWFWNVVVHLHWSILRKNGIVLKSCAAYPLVDFEKNGGQGKRPLLNIITICLLCTFSSYARYETSRRTWLVASADPLPHKRTRRLLLPTEEEIIFDVVGRQTQQPFIVLLCSLRCKRDDGNFIALCHYNKMFAVSRSSALLASRTAFRRR